MRQNYDRRCNYCDRIITMRKMPDGGWLPFEGGSQHSCTAKWLYGNAPYVAAVIAAGALILAVLIAQ
jgi:hypothetical protein